MNLKNALWILFISMIPLIELRGAVPVGTVLGLPFYINFAVAVIGNLIPVPFILLLIPKVLDFMERFEFLKPIVRWVRRRAEKNQGKIESSESSEPIIEIVDEGGKTIATTGKRKMSRATFLGLMLFVLLPVPGTGAWTGALVASLFEFPKLKSFLSIALGVVGCGVIMCLASYGVLGFLSFLL